MKKKNLDKFALTQSSTQNFATPIRDIADKAIFSTPGIQSLKVAFLGVGDMFEDLSKSLKDNSEKAMGLREKQLKISTAAQAVVQQISDREKITILEKGTTHMSHAIVKKMITDLLKVDHYEPIHNSNKLPINILTVHFPESHPSKADSNQNSPLVI